MKVALVTGVSKGIGRATAEVFLQNGWKVYGISRSQPDFTHENFVWLEFDLMQFERYSELNSLISEDLDLLVNNAGIAYAVPIEKFIELDLDKQWKINVKAPTMLIKTLLPKLANGKIIDVSSVAAFMNYEGLGIYAMTKAALTKFAAQFALESSIPIVSIMPSTVDTPMMKALDPNGDSSTYLKPGQVAGEIFKLAENGFESGSEIVVVNNALATGIPTANMPPNRKIVNVDLSQI